MSPLRAFSSVLIASLALAGLVGPAAAAGQDKTLHAVDQAWMKAYNAGDGATIANLYAADGCLFAPGHDVACGHAAILALMTGEAGDAKKAGVTLMFFATIDDSSSGDTGWNSGRYTVTVGGKVVGTGKYLSVLRKTNGKWRIIRDIWNSDPEKVAAK